MSLSPQTIKKDEESKEAGFTLVELMVVVSVLGILAALATAGMSNSDPELEKTGNSLSLRIADASREAKMAGPISAAIASAEGDTSRTRLQISSDANGQFFAVDLRKEALDNISSSYEELSRVYVKTDTLIYGVEEGVARTEPGGTVTTLSGDYELFCSADGACGPITFYLKTTTSPEKKSRVVVMPMSSIPLVFTGW